MRRLVALAWPGGSGFVDELQRIWDAGDAVLPVDLRLPPPSRKRLLDALAPHMVVGPDGIDQRPGGLPTDDGDALVVATSGTTGEPKGVVLTHDAVRTSALATSRRLAAEPDTDRWLACLPLSHVGGLAVVTRSIHTGVPVEVHDGFDSVAVSAAARRGATLVSLVPTALARIDPSLFRVVLVGGSAPPRERPAHVLATYGLTETGSGVVYEGEPLDGVEVRVVDGEVQVRGPMLLRAYRNGSDPKLAGGWLPTGDAGELGADGRLRVFGRRGEMIVTGGENVWPAAVEAVLARHWGIAAVAVVGRADPEWGQRVTAVAVPTDRTDLPRLEELRDHVRAELPAFCAPRSIEWVDDLPRTPLGKVRRQTPGEPGPPG